jgi:hypothetical protein
MSAVQPPPAGGGESTEKWAERWIEEIRASLPEAPKHERPAASARLASMLIVCARDEEADAFLMSARRDAVRAGDARELARIEIALAGAALARDDDGTAQTRLASAREQLPSPPPSIAARMWLLETRLARLADVAVPPPPPEPEANADDPLDPDERILLAAELALERAQVAREDGILGAAHTELAKAHEIVDLAASQYLVAAFELEAA